MGITDYFGIQALSMTSYAKFQNFQAPNPFSTTLQALKSGKETFSRAFKDFQGGVATVN